MNHSHLNQAPPPNLSPLPPRARVLACRVLAPELSALGLEPPQVVYLEQGLHRHPDDLRKQLAESLAEIEQDPEVFLVVLGYGFCGGGLDGLTSRRVTLAVPLVHDCIPLLLGAHPAPPGPGQGHTFYLSPGWVEHGQTPLTEYHACCQRLGEEDALWVGREMLKGYDRVSLIRHPWTAKGEHVVYANEMAELFNMSYQELAGDLAWLQRLVAARPGQGVVLVPPGRPLDLAMFPSGPPASYPQEA